tara:strand:- start:215 stop:484 length:270 start_codon:yes stop_codon:yes gene_type:complete
VLIDVLLSEQSMGAYTEAVIGGVDDDCVFSSGRVLDGVKDATDLGIEVSDEPVIFAELITDDRLCARVGSEAFVPFFPIKMAIVKRMVG